MIAIADGASRNTAHRDLIPRLDDNPGQFSTDEYEDLVGEEDEWVATMEEDARVGSEMVAAQKEGCEKFKGGF